VSKQIGFGKKQNTTYKKRVPYEKGMENIEKPEDVVLMVCTDSPALLLRP
jgi:hypothetical protein